MLRQAQPRTANGSDSGRRQGSGRGNDTSAAVTPTVRCSARLRRTLTSDTEAAQGQGGGPVQRTAEDTGARGARGVTGAQDSQHVAGTTDAPNTPRAISATGGGVSNTARHRYETRSVTRNQQ